MVTMELPLALSITFNQQESVISLTLFDSPTPERTIPLELKFKYGPSSLTSCCVTYPDPGR